MDFFHTFCLQPAEPRQNSTSIQTVTKSNESFLLRALCLKLLLFKSNVIMTEMWWMFVLILPSLSLSLHRSIMGGGRSILGGQEHSGCWGRSMHTSLYSWKPHWGRNGNQSKDGRSLASLLSGSSTSRTWDDFLFPSLLLLNYCNCACTGMATRYWMYWSVGNAGHQLRNCCVNETHQSCSLFVSLNTTKQTL